MLGCSLELIPVQTKEIPDTVTRVIAAEPAEQPVIKAEYQTLYKTRDFTYEEAQMLMQIAQAEAGNQGIKGMELIIAVILNRVADEDYPSTIESVIFQESQFYTKGMTSDLCVEAHEALAYVESGRPLDTSIIAFEVSSSSFLDRYFEYAFTYGDHKFYRKGEKKDVRRSN